MHLIESNFREIHHSLKYPGGLQSPLVANLSGTRIYDSRYCWGRLWCRFYSIFDWVLDLRANALKRAVQYTHSIFLREMANIQLALNTYLKYLKLRGKGYDIKEKTFSPIRDNITNWNASTKPFLKLINKTAVKNNLTELLCNLPAPGFAPPEMNTLRLCQNIIDLEGHVGSLLPLPIFKKFLRDIPRNAIDLKVLIKWINKIDTLELKVNPVHKGLQAIVEIYGKDKSSKEIQSLVAEIELLLENKGCKVFQQNDEKLLEWRISPKKDQKFLLNGMEVILGPKISSDISENRETRTFLIEGQPDHLALIANNRAALPLRNMRMRNESLMGIKTLQTIDISADGRVALLPRLEHIHGCWTSKYGTITQEDAPVIKALAGLVQGFINQNFTPPDFSAASLMLNTDRKLIYMNPISKGPFDFNALESFLLECTGDNYEIFRQLMVKSGLNKHPIAKFYRSIVENVLEKNGERSDLIAGKYKITDPKITDQALVLSEKVKRLKNKLILKLEEGSPGKHPTLLEKEANYAILRKYLHYKRAGIFWYND